MYRELEEMQAHDSTSARDDDSGSPGTCSCACHAPQPSDGTPAAPNVRTTIQAEIDRTIG
jgi:hypothetical protein